MEWSWKLLTLGMACYTAFCALIYFMQPGMIFYPNIPGRELVTSPQNKKLKKLDKKLDTQ